MATTCRSDDGDATALKTWKPLDIGGLGAARGDLGGAIHGVFFFGLLTVVVRAWLSAGSLFDGLRWLW